MMNAAVVSAAVNAAGVSAQGARGGAMGGAGALAPMLAAVHVGPIQFDTPVWLWLIPIGWAVCVLVVIGRRGNLSGLGSTTRWTALAVRLVVVLLVGCAMAEPQLRRESDDVAVTVVLDASDSVPLAQQRALQAYVREAAEVGKQREDLLGLVTVARDAYVQALPSRLKTELEGQHTGAPDGTDLASGIRLAMATQSREAASRILLASDGNQTAGNLLEAAQAAKALGVPVDVLPLRFKFENEVLVDRVLAPGAAREGEALSVRVVLQAVKATEGRLLVQMNGEALDLDPDTAQVGTRVTLRQGLNVFTVPVTARTSGPQRFDAVFEPDMANGQAVGDSRPENNKGTAVTFVAGEGRVLLVRRDPKESEHLERALVAAKIRAEVVDAGMFPTSLTELNAYDAVILVNQESYGFTQRQQEELRQYVHDSGGGLVMVGGPDTFGAGGWIGSAIEETLPLRLDPPQKRQMPRGALALVMHSVEMPEGTFYGKKVCEAAVNALSRLDIVGINEYDWQRGDTFWVHPLSPVGDGTAVKRAIQGLTFGDMQDFTPSIRLTLEGLTKVDAGQRHVIIISDGDPSPPPASLLDRYRDARITISTVGVFPHSGLDTSTLRWLSEYTGGRHYDVNTTAALAKVPQIFIKEAQTVRRSLIWEGEPFVPTMESVGADTLRGIGAVPPIRGYVVTAEREGLALVTLKGKEGDPVLAQWQHGLGRVVAFTSDAATRWASPWVEWAGFNAFWEQQVRYAMRPASNPNVRVTTENRGDQTVITVDALDSTGERLNFAAFSGRLARPDGTGAEVVLRQVGPGRYQASVDTRDAGSYVLGLRYAARDEGARDGLLEGTAQAAISRPFADEFRTLEDNTALLTQVAEMTGGRVLSGDARRDQLWDRTGLTMPVALTPIWLAVAAMGLGLFLVDVGIRRVRIDVAAMARAVARGLGREKARESAQIGALRGARQSAQAKIAERAARSGVAQGGGASGGAGGGAGASGAGTSAGASGGARQDPKVARAKFEASEEQLKRVSTQGPPALGGADAKPRDDRPYTPKDAGTAAKAVDAAEGMNRLLKAKQKAREDMGDEGKNKGKGV